MTQTAVDAVQLVEQFWGFAHKVANRWAKTYPHLRQDFQSEAAFTLWQAATSYNSERGTFDAWLSFRLRLALWDVRKRESRTSPVSFATQPTDRGDQTATPLDAVRSREPDPAQAVELLDAPLLLAKVPEHRRADFMRWLEGTPSNTRGADQEIAPAAARQRVYHDMRRLRELVATDD
jgi:DNA-directed RNA polymerase specialized sigma subunit